MEKCPICGGQVQERLDDFRHVYRGVPVRLTDIPYQVCLDCGEELIDSRYGKIIEETIDQYRQYKDYEYDDLITCEEVSALLAVSYQVVIGMLSDGKLPGTKIGREWRIPYGVMIDYIQSLSANNLSQPEKDIYESSIKLYR